MDLTKRPVNFENKTKKIICFEGCCFIPEYEPQDFKYNKVLNKKCNKK